MMSLAGFFSLLPLWLYLTITSEISIKTSKSFFIACLSHAAYNIISITLVLSVFDPLQHALLNVIKRVSIVLVFYLLVQKVPSPLNIISGIACISVSIIATKVNKILSFSISIQMICAIAVYEYLQVQSGIPSKTFEKHIDNIFFPDWCHEFWLQCWLFERKSTLLWCSRKLAAVHQ